MSNKSLCEKSRKWQLTINNPNKYGLDHIRINEILNKFKLDYFCMCDEIGEQGTPHTHIYIYRENAIRFSTIQNRFKVVHIEPAYGSSQENREYIRKEGKWKESEKKGTNIIETFEEMGELPNDKRDKKTEEKVLLQRLIDDGYTNEQIIREFPQFTYRLDSLDKIRQTLLFSKYQCINRDVRIYYLYGDTATGKSHFVHNIFKPQDIYVVSDYEHPFDNYIGQKCVVFEEFRSSLKYQDMLQYLDIYPIQLGARYSNKTACYEYVFIVSNINLDEQYKYKFEDENSKRAFYRRINKIIEFTKIPNKPYNDYFYIQKAYEDIEDYHRGIECEMPKFNIYDEEEKEEDDESKME